MNKKFYTKRVPFIIFVAAMISACTSTTIVKPKETLLGSWVITTIQTKSVIAQSSPSLSFNTENKLSGSASCNNISSSYTSKNSSLTIGAVATTRKMCLPALMEQESHLLQALGKVKRFQLNNGQLSMYDQRGSLQLQAKASEREKSRK